MSYLGRSAKLSLKAQEKVSFLATAGQTVKTGLAYVAGFVEVILNGSTLTDVTDYTATDGNSITFLGDPLTLNDEVTIVSLKTFTLADHYTKIEAVAKFNTSFPFYKSDSSSGTISMINGQLPFYKADGTEDNIGVS